MRRIVLVLLMVLMVCAAACEETTKPDIPSGPDLLTGSRAVSFTTDDGVTLRGHLFGTGATGVILAHMYPADQRSWYPTAQTLAAQGYLVLTFDFRGYGESDGSKDIAHLNKDAFAAIIACADAGAFRMVLVGASMGGTASLIAADQSQVLSRLQVTGVVTLSAPVAFKGLSCQEAVPRLYMPLLFIAGADDVGAGEARKLQDLAGGEGDLQIVSGAEHGTELLEGPESATVLDLMLGFLETNLPPAGR